MNNRNIVFAAPGRAEIVERPMPTVSDGQVLVRLVRSCISSGTERAQLTGVPDVAISIFSTAPDGQVTWPRQVGYSSSGVVEAVGAGVSSVRVGDRVAMSWSTHAQFLALPEEQVYRIPEGVSFEDAALSHIATFPMAAIRKCRLELGESALVMGQGILGQMAVVLLAAVGAAPVMVADPQPAKREQALRLGADYAFDPLSPGFAADVASVTGRGRKVVAGRVDDRGANVVIEVTGHGSALNQALDAVAPFGRIALLGCSRDSNFTVDYYHKVHGRGVTLVGAHTMARPEKESSPAAWTTRDDAESFLRLLSCGRVRLGNFVSEVHPVSEAPEVFGRLAADAAFPVVQCDWSQV